MVYSYPGGLYTAHHSYRYTGKRVTGIPATIGGKRVVSGTYRARGPGFIRRGEFKDGKEVSSRKVGKSSEKEILVSNKMGKTKVIVNYKKGKKNKKQGVIRKYIPATIQPKRKLVRFKTVNYGTIENASGALASWYISLLDITDPFGAGSNQQPLGYDQWKTLYKQGVVIGSKVTIRYHNRSTVSYMVGITPCSVNQGNTPLSNYEHYMEAKGTKARLLSPDIDHTTMFHKVSTKKHLGLRNLMDEISYHNTDLDAESGPNVDCFWHIWAQPQDQSSSTSNAGATSIQLVMTAEYIVLLHDPIVPSTRPTHA